MILIISRILTSTRADSLS